MLEGSSHAPLLSYRYFMVLSFREGDFVMEGTESIHACMYASKVNSC
jgi:hypothetical protein